MKEELNRKGILFNEVPFPAARAGFLAKARREDSSLRQRIDTRVETALRRSNSGGLFDAVCVPQPEWGSEPQVDSGGRWAHCNQNSLKGGVMTQQKTYPSGDDGDLGLLSTWNHCQLCSTG
jgi:hypothetical protein